MDMKEKLQELAEAAKKRIDESEGLDKLNEVRVAYLGKKGELTAILKSMKDVLQASIVKNIWFSRKVCMINQFSFKIYHGFAAGSELY